MRKPKAKLVGKDGNIFNLMGIASRSLKKAGQVTEAKEMVERIMSEARSYGEALCIIQEYCDIE